MSQANDFISNLEYILQRAGTPGNDKEIQSLFNLYRQLISFGQSVFRQVAITSATYPGLKNKLKADQDAFEERHKGQNLDAVIQAIADFKEKHPVKEMTSSRPINNTSITSDNVNDNGLDGQDEDFAELTEDYQDKAAVSRKQAVASARAKTRVVNDGIPRRNSVKSNAPKGSIDYELDATIQALKNLEYQFDSSNDDDDEPIETGVQGSAASVDDASQSDTTGDVDFINEDW